MGTVTWTTTLAQSGPESNERVLHITLSSMIGASLSDGVVLYPGNLLLVGGSYLSAEMQALSSTASANWVSIERGAVFVYKSLKLKSFRVFFLNDGKLKPYLEKKNASTKLGFYDIVCVCVCV